MDYLTTGNTAKLYCLNWIEDTIKTHGESVSILDLGSGTSNNFVKLLHRYPKVEYLGIEPSEGACEAARKALAGTNAKIIHGLAYDMRGESVQKSYDILVSFSVMEHVVQRQRFLNSAAACMHAESSFLMNYDAGHFVYPQGLKERAKNILGPMLAMVGNENYYQKFVKEADFRQMVEKAALRVEEAKSFNTLAKGIHKLVPSERQDEHLQRWLDYELWLNEAGIDYKDSDAKYWVTRNFILRKK